MTSARDVHRVLLVGFMGSGKSTVGPLLAARLGWTFIDVDATIECEEGMSVADIFRTRGEAYFRAAEARVAGSVLEQDGVVIGSGGGWGASAERLRCLPPGTASVWLRVSPQEAVRRVSTAADVRPLLAHGDPLEAARRLTNERAAGYGAAQVGVDTDARTPEDVVEEILEEIRDLNPKSGARSNVTKA